MKSKGPNFVLGLCAMIFGIAIIMIGKNANMVFMSGNVPGMGFLPFLTAWGIGICGFVLLVGSLIPSKTENTNQETESKAGAIWVFKLSELWYFVIVVGVSILIMFLTNHLGLLVSLAVGAVIMSKLFGTPGFVTPLWVGGLTWVVLWAIFDWFLKTPMPQGIFGL